jgi:hypothetical protein
MSGYCRLTFKSRVVLWPVSFTDVARKTAVQSASRTRVRKTVRRISDKPKLKRKGNAKSARLSRRTRARRWVPNLRGARGLLKIFMAAVIVLALSLTINWVYQVIRKPSELFFPVSGTLFKTPTATWRSYSPLFRQYATMAIAPEFLAALAQAEGAGNPVARTYWRWSWGTRPFDVYRPASSSVGMYQMTDGTFAEARNFCIRAHQVVPDGPWSAWHSCWFNSLYFRVLPSHAVELTSSYLDLHVADILARNRIAGASLQQKQHLAATIHLCGAGAADLYARRGFRFVEGQRCGEHDPRAYLARIDALKHEFSRLAADE